MRARFFRVKRFHPLFEQLRFADAVATSFPWELSFFSWELSFFSWESLVFAVTVNTNGNKDRNNKSADRNVATPSANEFFLKNVC